MFTKLKNILRFSKISREEVFEDIDMEEVKVSLDTARKAQQDVISCVKRLGLKEVEGVGIAPSKRGYSVKINLSAPLPFEDAKRLPKEVNNVRVQTQVSGRAVTF